MPLFSFPKDARVTTTGTFQYLNPIKEWIANHGGIYIPWGPHISHILVGESPPTWKLSKIVEYPHIQILHESELIVMVPTELWVDKYKPTTLQEVIGHSQQVKDLEKWLQSFQPFKTKPVAAFLTGPPGIGKTTTAHLVCRHLGWDVVELNASDTRSATAIREILDKAGKSAAFGSSAKQTKRVLLLDEVDGMSSSDRGGIAALSQFLKSGSAFPILCIANERTSPKLRSLASTCLDIRFSRPTKTTIAKTLHATVVRQERLTVSQAELEILCEQTGNDIRAIVNSLQFSTTCRGKKDEILRTDIFSATGRLFGKTAKTMDEKMNLVFLDSGMIPLMVHEGYIQAAEKSRESKETTLERCWKAAESLGSWDILDKRIHRTQAWGLLPAASTAVIQAAETVAGPAPFQIFPAWLGKNSKRLKHKRYIQELRENLGSNEEGLLDSRDAVRARLYDPALTPIEVITTLTDLGLTRDNMLEHLVEISFKDSEPMMETKKKTAITREWNKLHVCKLKKENEDDDRGSIVSNVDELEYDEFI